MTKQDIAKSLTDIDWTAVECDSAIENDALHFIGRQLLSYPPHEVIDLLFHVLGANLVIPDLQEKMKEFRYVNTSTGNYLINEP